MKYKTYTYKNLSINVKNLFFQNVIYNRLYISETYINIHFKIVVFLA